jgi:hypothetical protein
MGANMSYLVVDAGGVVAIDLLSALKKSRVAPVGVGLALRPAHIAKHFGYAAQLFGVVVLFLCAKQAGQRVSHKSYRWCEWGRDHQVRT